MRDLLTDAVRLRLRSDVPVGSCLSGGIDSTTVLCLASRLLKGPEDTWGKLTTTDQLFSFTIGHTESSCDERRWSRLAARWAGATPVEHVPSADELWKEWSRTAYHQDEPFGSASVFSQWALMKVVHQTGLKVLLDGQGADELFAGYNVYPQILLAERIRGGRYISALRQLCAEVHGSRWSTWWRLVRLAIASDVPTMLQTHRGLRNAYRQLSWVRTPWREVWAKQSAELHNARRHTMVSLRDRLAEDHFMYNLPSLLRYEDRNSMAFSIETRLPFLDYRLVDYVLALSADRHIVAGCRKYLLRKAMSGVIPPEIENRTDKMGFTTPERLWLRQFLGEIREQLLTSPCAAQYVETRRIADTLGASLANGVGKTGVLWRILCLDVWARAMSEARTASRG